MFASSGQRRRGVAAEISVPVPPSATIGGPAGSRARELGLRGTVGTGGGCRCGEGIPSSRGTDGKLSCGTRSGDGGRGPPFRYLTRRRARREKGSLPKSATAY